MQNSVINFDVFCFDRAAKERLLYSVSVEHADNAQVDVLEVVRVLRFLYPRAAGVRVTIM